MRRNFHGGVLLADDQLRVHGPQLVRVNLDAPLNPILKSGHANLDAIGAGRQIRRAEVSGGIGSGFARNARPFVSDGYLCSWNRRAALVDDCTFNSARVLSDRAERKEYQ